MKTALTLFSLVLSLSLFASVNPIELLIQATPASHSLTLRTKAPVKYAATVQILDASGIVLHTAKLEAGAQLNRKFELSALPAGQYRIVASDEVAKTVQPINLDRQGILVDEALATLNYYPRVLLKEDMLTVNYLNSEGGQVNIRLADQVGNELLNDNLTGTPAIHRAYNLEKLPAGSYYVTVYAPDISAHTTRLFVN